MNILITGGAGFIGSNIANRLIDLGHSITIIDNESTGLKSNVPPKARYYKGSINSHDDLKLIFKPADKPFLEASAVLTFACTETNIPTYPAIPDNVAPIK